MRREFNLIFWLGIVFFLGVSGLAGWSLLQLHNEIQTREETSVIQDKLGELYDTLLEADVTFLILKNFQDENDVEKLLKQLKQAKRQVDDLSKLIQSKSKIHKDVLELRQMVFDKVNLSEKLVTSLDLEAPEAFERVLVLQDDLILTHKVNDKIKSIEAYVVTNLEKHRAYVERYFSVNMITIVGAVLMTFFFFLTFARLVFSEIDRRQVLEKDLRQAQESAIQASNLKSQFLATVSHEIRTPLNGIIGISELLRERVSGEAQSYTQILQNSGRTLLRIVNDILDFSKIEANKINIEIQEVKLSHTLEAAVELFATQANSKKITLTCSYDLALENIFATDGGRLSQVLHNLINNAIKFTETGAVEIRGYQASENDGESRIHFSVADSGPGVSADKTRLIFEPFYQTETHHQHSGTGLGLAISKKLIELMGGKIGFENRQGGGSLFWFELPIRKIHNDKTARTAITGKIAVFALPDAITRFVSDFGRDNQLPIQKIENSAALGPLTAQDTLIVGPEVLTNKDLTQFKGKIISPVFSAVEISAQHNLLTMPLSYERFWRTLKLSKTEELPNIEKKLSSVSFNTSAPAVLLVEDNPTNQILVKAQAEQIGYLVNLVSDGKACLKELESKKYDLILMDCRMPVMDGFEATRNIRERETQSRLKRTTIVAMTANASEEDRQKCISAGMDDYLTKPFELSALEKVLNKWVPLGANEVDWSVLEELSKKMNGEVVLRLIESFKSSLAKSIVEFEAFADEGKWHEFVLSAHRLKSSAAALGAKKLSALCQSAEDQIEKQSEPISGLALDFVGQIIGACRSALSEYKNQNRF